MTHASRQLIPAAYGMILLTAIWATAQDSRPDGARSPLTSDTPSRPTTLPYCIVDTGQAKCYDNRGEMATPKPGQAFYGQDAQFPRHAADYILSGDGLTVYDQNTRLTWQRSPETNDDGKLDHKDKLTWKLAQALPAKLNAAKFGGFADWRLPSIKELYSLFDARGTDPSGPGTSDTSKLTPFINATFFKFAYGDAAAGERTIDSQWATSTLYVGKSARGFGKLFGVNFADGRIKGYDLQMPGGADKTFFVLCVRGNREYGKNDFRDNGDGTISDRATGLMWSKTDSGMGMNWQDALAWVQKKNTEKYLGHDDWRLANVKELQSIVDYTRSPDTSQSPAIDTLFKCTEVTNAAGKDDYPYDWSSTTHVGWLGGAAAMYVSFGRAAGWMSQRAMAGGPPDRRGQPGPGRRPTLAGPPPDGPPPDWPPGDELPPDAPRRQPTAGQPASAPGEYQLVDVHGAGSQRSDPKAGDPAMFPHGRGPQGDVITINNYVRLVRYIDPRALVLRSPDAADGGPLPKDYTGDGTSSTLPLEWSGTPEGTESLAVIMHHIAPDKTKWYWILYNIPPNTTTLPRNVTGIGTLGNNSVNGRAEYAPPHSKGPGQKIYVYTLYALSSPVGLDVPPAHVSRDVLLAAMKDKIIASAELRVVYSRNVPASQPQELANP